jgi:hypothetical protein
MPSQRIDILAREILKHFQHTATGHCARVDFLPREEAQAICQHLQTLQQENNLRVYVLANKRQTISDDFTITIDYAIELRNRKEEKLCLFIPTDVVDATASSLSNAFAVIDGRVLYENLLRQLRLKLSEQGQKVVQGVFGQLLGVLKISKEQQISFISAVLEREEQGQLDLVGLELWRVGLIVDSRPVIGSSDTTFLDFLDNNKRCVRALVHPTRLQASLSDRLQSLLVDAETERKLQTFFRGKSLQDVSNWSQALIEHKLTFEHWCFPEEDRSDIKEVTVQSFLDSANAVERYCHLTQPKGPGTNLQIICDPKSAVTVRWKAKPPHPRNLKYWRVEMLPSTAIDSEPNSDTVIDLPSSEVPASRTSLSIKVGLELERPLAVIVRVTPIEVSGQPSVNPETNEHITHESNEFFLMPVENGVDNTDGDVKRQIRSEVTTIALGRLEHALQTRSSTLEESGEQWSSKELEYFNVRLDNKRMLTLGLSPILKVIEEQTLQKSRSGGIFYLTMDQVRIASGEKCQIRNMIYGTNEIWKSFWHARENFFKHLRESRPRDLIEVAKWTPELVGLAIKYVQSYQGLIQLLLQKTELAQKDQLNDANLELREALSLDTLMVRVRDGTRRVEEALITLPTHPLRVAWLIGYTQLLKNWEEQLFERTKPAARKGTIDIESLRLLSPMNTPVFGFHADSPEPFVFFQNIRFYHGVLLPIGIPDPHRRYSEITTILGADSDQVAIGTIQPAQLATHLKRFIELHPYMQTLVTTLVNPDRGDFFAEALKQLAQNTSEAEDDQESKNTRITSFQVTSYVEDERKSSVQALYRIRQTQLEQFNNSGGSYFLPGLSTTLRTTKQLQDDELADAHIAIISDVTQPRLSLSTDTGEDRETRSFTLYGLICRFVPSLQRDATAGLIWRYQILTERLKPSEAHPVKGQYSDMLINLHALLLKAGAYFLGGGSVSSPVLEVRLDDTQRRLLERIHQNSNWVITLDRFFALDYYDSPHIAGLDEMARKYVLDYAPEFSEGLGHRLMITTSWHEEIGGLLRHAMEEHGLAAIDNSVSHLLHHLKIVSGSLALQALESRTSASAAVGLGLVTAWLQKKNRLRQGVLVPVDLHPRLFLREGGKVAQEGDRRCDLALFSLKRGIVEVVFIEVKWRRGRVPFDRIGEEMYLQMQSSRRMLEDRFFNPARIDGALQRSHLGNVLRFYFERACRYGLFDREMEHTFLERLAELEKAGLEFRYYYEGYIVSLNERATTFPIGEAKIRVLTAADFDTQTFPMLTPSPELQDSDSILAGTMLVDNEEEPTDKGDLLSDCVQRKRTENLETLQTVELQARDEEPVDKADSEQKKTPDLAEGVMVALGTSLQGDECQWHPSVKGSPHLFIIGIPGQGKSYTTTRLLVDLHQQGVPALVLDFHGQFANPNERFTQQIDPNVLNVAKGLPFSPFECSPESHETDIITNSLEVAEIFAHVTNLGPIQQDTLYNALLNAYREKGFGQADNAKPLEYPTLEEVLEQIKGARNADLIMARCRSLLEMKLFRPETGEANLLAQIRRGLVLDLHALLEGLQLAAGAFILRKVYKDMFRWGPADRLRLAIVLDEAHRLAKDITLPKIMKEGRKFGIVVIVASQELTDFHQGVIGNVGTKIIFRINHPDSRKVAGLLQASTGVDLARQISQLGVGNAYVQTPEMFNAIKVEMYS